jgi:hydroxyacylglutathione hydrolase
LSLHGVAIFNYFDKKYLMEIKQWEDSYLSHFSYGILSEKKIVLIDPSRNPLPYLEFAKANDATIVGIIETHPHADFVSSHKELSEKTGATVYVHSFVNAEYPHQTFDDGASFTIGEVSFTSLHTPGHSPDSISIVLRHEGKEKAVFTGDTLFIGDCGRPDLREGAGHIQSARLELARQMYHSLRNKLMTLPDDVLLYPAHGAGTLCGKALSKANSSTIGAEKKTNWSLQEMTEQEFIDNLLADQPFVPAYFPYNVEMNRKGAPAFEQSIESVKRSTTIKNDDDARRLDKNIMIIDARSGKDFKTAHLENSINLMEGTKFETWLGSIIKPGEEFYLAATDEKQLEELIRRTAAIGYETMIREAFILKYGNLSEHEPDLEDFKSRKNDYTIVDVRNLSEVKEKKIFPGSIEIPLHELRKRVNEIPKGKPVMVHCAGGYRSAAASSIIKSSDPELQVYDLSDAIKEFS